MPSVKKMQRLGHEKINDIFRQNATGGNIYYQGEKHENSFQMTRFVIICKNKKEAVEIVRNLFIEGTS